MSGGLQIAQTGPPQVYFDGIPSDLLYESATQINVVVPMTVKQTTTTQVEFGGVRSEPIAVPIGR